MMTFPTLTSWGCCEPFFWGERTPPPKGNFWRWRSFSKGLFCQVSKSINLLGNGKYLLRWEYWKLQLTFQPTLDFHLFPLHFHAMPLIIVILQLKNDKNPVHMLGKKNSQWSFVIFASVIIILHSFNEAILLGRKMVWKECCFWLTT